jgi:Mg-chelatase subunit ChlD
LALLTLPAAAQLRLLVTAVEQKTGRPIGGLSAADFVFTDGRDARPALEAKAVSGEIDVMLLVDSSLAGHIVQPVAFDLIDQLKDREQMAIVGYADSADLVQDFTSSKEILKRSLAALKYGNAPRILDALAAAISDGFENATYRRVILLVTSGLEGYSRTHEREVIRLARRNGVSVFPVYASGMVRGLLETIARNTGGAVFNLRELSRDAGPKSGARIFEALRNHYIVTLRGSAPPSEKMKVEIKRPEKAFVSALPLE